MNAVTNHHSCDPGRCCLFMQQGKNTCTNDNTNAFAYPKSTCTDMDL